MSRPEGFWRSVADLGRPLNLAVLDVGIGVGGAFADTDLDDELRPRRPRGRAPMARPQR